MNRNLINKEAEDYGWAEMQKLLDKEMPLAGATTIPPQYQGAFPTEKEQKERRWLPLIWLLGGLLLISAAYFIYSAWSNNQEKPATKEEKPIYVDKNVDKVEKANINTTLNTLNSKKEAALAQNSHKGLFKTNIINKRTETNSLLVNTFYSTNNSTEKIDNQYISEQKEDIFSRNQITQKDENSVSVNTNSQNTISAENTSIVDKTETLNRNIAVVDELPILENTFLAVDNDYTYNKSRELADLNTLKGRLISINIKNKLKFGATAGLHTEGVKIIGGYQIGGFIKKKLNSKLPISLQAGLNFRNTNVKGDSVTFVQLDNAAFATNSTPVAGFQLANGTEVKLENLGYAEMPLVANYQFNSKWNIACGIKAAYLLFNKTSFATWTRLYMVENTAVSGKSAQNDQASNFVFDNSIQALGLNRFDMAFLGEVSYAFFPNISASLRLDYGLNNIMTRKNWAAYNRFLGLNVSYVF